MHIMNEAIVDSYLPTDKLIASLPPLITIKQAESTGAASGRTLRKMCQRGELRATKVGTDWRIARDPFLRRFALSD